MSPRENVREFLLEVAEGIVKNQGAARLTFDELSRGSGVTRGGITYHFPTKDRLLSALLERDVEQWEQREAQLRPLDVAAPSAELIGYLRAFVVNNEEKRRFVAGMLSAVAHDPDLLDPVRARQNHRIANIEWSEAELHRQVLRFAAEGMFWSEFFRCTELPPGIRERVAVVLENLAMEWTTAPKAP